MNRDIVNIVFSGIRKFENPKFLLNPDDPQSNEIAPKKAYSN
jgi:hypothetical protein